MRFSCNDLLLLKFSSKSGRLDRHSFFCAPLRVVVSDVKEWRERERETPFSPVGDGGGGDDDDDDDAPLFVVAVNVPLLGKR